MRPVWMVAAALVLVAGAVACDGPGNPRPDRVPNVEGKPLEEAKEIILEACPGTEVRFDPADIFSQLDQRGVKHEIAIVFGQGSDTRPPADAPTSPDPPTTPAESPEPTPEPSAQATALAAVAFVQPAPDNKCSDTGYLVVTLRAGVIVPDVVGRPVQEAHTVLRESGLDWTEPQRPGFHVVGQRPKGGERVLFAEVSTTVVELELDIKVPNVVGRTGKDACEILRKSELVCPASAQAVTDRSVESQNPTADGYAKPGDTVTIQLGPVNVTLYPVPDVVGKGRDQACRLIEQASLQCDPNEDVAYGDSPYPVLRIDPPAGRPLGRGATVRIWVPQPRRVPPLVDLTADEACRRLEPIGLRCKREPLASKESKNLVLGQSPAEGEVLGKDGIVTLNIASGLVVPDLRDRTVGVACDLLQGMELVCERGSHGTDWIVTGQSIAAGTPVLRLEKVTLAAKPPAKPPTTPPAGPGCDGWSILGFCADPVNVLSLLVGVAALFIATLEFRRRRARTRG